MPEAHKLQPLPLHERSRTYYFPKGESVIVNGATHLNVTRLGNHRLGTADGKVHEVPGSFLHLEIDSDWAPL